MNKDSRFDQEVVDIAYIEIANSFGDVTARLYKEYFKYKNSDEVLATLQKLLSENLGPKKSDEKMFHIQNVLKQYSPVNV